MAATHSKTLRFPAHVNAAYILEKLVVHDWEATGDRGLVGYTSDRTTLTVYMEALQVKVTGTKKQLEKWCGPIEQRLGNVPVAISGDEYIDPDLVAKTRGYIEEVVRQINVCYANRAYDCLSVMLRRLLETLLIELFIAESLEATIKDGSGHFFYLSGLIQQAVKVSDATGGFTLSRNAKKALDSLKECGDLSAHNRTYLAKKSDVDSVKAGARLLTQELLALSKIKQK